MVICDEKGFSVVENLDIVLQYCLPVMFVIPHIFDGLPSAFNYCQDTLTLFPCLVCPPKEKVLGFISLFFSFASYFINFCLDFPLFLFYCNFYITLFILL